MTPFAAVSLAVLLVSSRWKTRRCSSVGRWPRVQGKLLVDNGGTIRLGHKVRVRGTHLPVELAAMPGGVLEIGDQTYINSGTSLCAAKLVRIGARCAIGNLTLIMDTDFHSTDDHSVMPEAKAVPAKVRRRLELAFARLSLGLAHGQALLDIVKQDTTQVQT